MNLVWSGEARSSIRAIITYIAQFDPDAADRVLDRILQQAERLTEYPYMYRSGRVEGTREALVHPNYILVYRVTASAVEVLRIVHTRQLYP